MQQLQGRTFKKILVQRADRLGDVVFTLPVIQWIRAQYPDAEIHFLSSKMPGELLKFQSDIDRVHRIPDRMTVMALLGVASVLKRHQFDLYISLWNDPWMAWLGRLAHIPVRIGDSTNTSLSWLYTHTVRQTWECLVSHQIELNMQLLQPLGWSKAMGWTLAAEVASEARAQVAAVLDQENDGDLPVVTFFCGTGGSNSPIPDSTILNAMEGLCSDYQVVLLGQISGTSELKELEMPGVINRINATSVAELSAWIAASNVVVGADTGPIHIAAAFQRPVVFIPLRKSNLPVRWGPWTSDLEIVRRDYLCEAVPPAMCGDPQCAALPSGLDLVRSVRRLLEAPQVLSGPARRRLLMRHSFHVLTVNTSPVHAHAMARLALRWQSEGVVVIPRLSRPLSMTDIVTWVLRYNALVVVAPDLSPLNAWLIRFWISVRYQYLPPLILRRSLGVDESVAPFISDIHEWFTDQRGVL